MRRQVLLFSTMIAFAAPAYASPPECPCWEGVVGLTLFVASVDPLGCTPHPNPSTSGSQIVAAGITDEGGGIMALAIAQPSAPEPNPEGVCRTGSNPNQNFIHTSIPVAWACIRDITAVCRGLGF